MKRSTDASVQKKTKKQTSDPQIFTTLKKNKTKKQRIYIVLIRGDIAF